MFKKEIIRLIELRQEGAYWDFKREWYSKDQKADLLHDIICMANNLQNKDAYIIIGINEENNYEVKSVLEDLNRWNTQKLVDFLKDKKFAGDERPIVYVESIKLFDEMIDIIVIKNTLLYEIHKFYYVPDGDEADTSHNRFMESVLLFNSKEELENFKEYVLVNWNRSNINREDIWTPHFPDIEGYHMEEFKKEFIDVQILQKMLIQFRKSE